MKKPGQTPPTDMSLTDKAGADLRARFATPIETDRPVNPDDGSEQQFAARPAAERAPGKTK